MQWKSTITRINAFFFLLFSVFSGLVIGDTIPNGGSLGGSIDAFEEIDTHEFSGEEGQRGVISVSGNVGGGEYIEFYNPDGSPLIQEGVNNENGTGSHAYIILEQTGQYRVDVSAFPWNGLGQYRVHLALAPGANEHGLIPNGRFVSQSINDDGEIDSFTFNGNAGEVGLISVAGSVGGGEYIYVFNPDGTQLHETGEQSEGQQILITLEQSGVHTVITRSFDGQGVGPYTINLFFSSSNLAQIQGRKWQDKDGDGMIDADESGLAGVSIYLDLNDNTVFDAGEPMQVTNSTGNYRFTELAAGNYVVREVVPDCSTQTFPIGGAHNVELQTGEIATDLDFGNQSSLTTPGDITGEDIVDVRDLLLCTRIVLGLLSSPNECACDVAPLDYWGAPLGDNQRNAGDIGVLLRMVMGM